MSRYYSSEIPLTAPFPPCGENCAGRGISSLPHESRSAASAGAPFDWTFKKFFYSMKPKIGKLRQEVCRFSFAFFWRCVILAVRKCQIVIFRRSNYYEFLLSVILVLPLAACAPKYKVTIANDYLIANELKETYSAGEDVLAFNIFSTTS